MRPVAAFALLCSLGILTGAPGCAAAASAPAMSADGIDAS